MCAARDAAADPRRGPLVRRRRRRRRGVLARLRDRLAALRAACGPGRPDARAAAARAASIRPRSAASRCSRCSDAPVVALAACAALTGATLPPIGACMRALWPSLLPGEELRDTAYALEAWLQELFFVVGPLIVAVLAAVGPPWAAVLAAAASAAAPARVWFALTPPVRAAERIARARTRARARSARRRCARSSWRRSRSASAFGVVEVCMPAFAEEHGSRAQGGFALACFCARIARSAASGSARARPRAASSCASRSRSPRWRWRSCRRWPRPSLPVMCVLMLIAGLPIAPAFAASYGLVDELALPGTTTEAFAWLGTAVVAGRRARHVVRRLRGRAVRPARRARAGRSVRGRRGAR